MAYTGNKLLAKSKPLTTSMGCPAITSSNLLVAGSGLSWADSTSNLTIGSGSIDITGLTYDNKCYLEISAHYPHRLSIYDEQGELAVQIRMADGRVTLPKGKTIEQSAVDFWHAVHKAFGHYWAMRPL